MDAQKMGLGKPSIIIPEPRNECPEEEIQRIQVLIEE